MESERDFANVTETPDEIGQNFTNVMNESYCKMDVNATPFHCKVS